ncbi:MAG: NADH-quinone oxidoreductase subunit D-related protein, partial [Thermoplasmata archaeon]
MSPSRDLALWNDLESHREILEVDPVLGPEEIDLLRNWNGAATGPRPVSGGQSVHGYGVFTFPYGPVAVGLGEAGSFDLRTYGERILEAVPTVGYKRRGIDARVVGRSVEDAALLIERRVGPFALAHAATFLAAAEAAAGRAVPERELWVRAIAQELQRLYGHLYVIARVADAASQNVGAAQLHALAEEILRLLGRTFGHRWGFGALLPHGPPRRLDPSHRTELARRLRSVRHTFDALWDSFERSRTFIDRLQATGTVSPQQAVRWGAVGPTLRGCGLRWDDRLRAPRVPYTDLFVPLATEGHGDALARVLVRRAEIAGSFGLLEEMLDRFSRIGEGEVPAAPPVGAGRGLARTEAPSGDLVYEVRLDGDRIAAVAVRTPSQANWPLVVASLRGAVFTDFAFSL